MKWREDISNQSNDYLRNIIRNQVIPAVEANLPDVRKRLKYSIGSLNASALLLEDYRKLLWNDIAKQKENEIWHLDILKLRKLQPNKTYLELLFAPYGIVDTKAFINLYDAENGKYIAIGNYTLYKFDTELIFADLDCINRYKGIDIVEGFSTKNTELDLSEVLINGTVVKHPLKLRIWNSKDTIKTSNGRFKKVSILLRELKVNPVDKKRTTVIKDGKRTVAIVGHYVHLEYRPLEKDALNWLIRCY